MNKIEADQVFIKVSPRLIWPQRASHGLTMSHLKKETSKLLKSKAYNNFHRIIHAYIWGFNVEHNTSYYLT